MITKEEVIRIAKLARLELTEIEIEKMQKDLSSILDYFAILKKAPAVAKAKVGKAKAKAKPSPTVRTVGLKENGTREDVAKQKPLSFTNNLIAQAPVTKDGYIKVKQIL